MKLVCSKCFRSVSSCGDSCPNCEHQLEGPKCPTCKSVAVEKISLGSKVVTAGLLGVLPLGHLSKTFTCADCGYEC